MQYVLFVFFCKQKAAYEMRISDWSSDVCSSDLPIAARELNIVDVASIGESRTSTIPDPSTGSSTVTSGTESKVGRAASSLPGPAETTSPSPPVIASCTVPQSRL